MRIIVSSLILFAALVDIHSQCAASDDVLNVSKISSAPDTHRSVVQLSNGTSFSVPLERLKLIAVLRTPAGAPRFLMSGADCTECDMNTSIYILKPVDQSGMMPRSVYPGKLKDYETGKLVQKTRMFYGKCLSKDDSVVWSMDYVGEDDKWHHQDSVTLMADENLEVNELSAGSFSLKSIIDKVSLGACKELPGIDGMTEP